MAITDEQAREVAEHYQKTNVEFHLEITRLHTEHDHVLGLLILNPYTIATGVTPLYFGSDPPEFPFPMAIVDVTREECQKVLSGELQLPTGWRLGASLVPWVPPNPAEVTSRFQRLFRE